MTESAPRSREDNALTVSLSGRLTLFGFPSSDALVRAVPRSRAWRGIRAATFFGGGLLLAPVVGMVPPHAPWAAGVLGVGIFLGLRKWREHFTMESLQGRCPKCGETMHVTPGTPMRDALSVTCDACHHDAQLSVDLSSDVPTSRNPRAAPGALPTPGGSEPGTGVEP